MERLVEPILLLILGAFMVGSFYAGLRLGHLLGKKDVELPKLEKRTTKELPPPFTPSRKELGLGNTARTGSPGSSPRE